MDCALHDRHPPLLSRLARLRAALPIAVLVLCTACATPATGPNEPPSTAAPASAAPVGQPPASAGSTRLAEARRLYDKGEFAEAARALQTSADIWSDAAEVRIEAYKLLAFSQCVLGRKTACRDTFDALLRLQPAFELDAAEASHPLWGPVFAQARRESVARQLANSRVTEAARVTEPVPDAAAGERAAADAVTAPPARSAPKKVRPTARSPQSPGAR